VTEVDEPVLSRRDDRVGAQAVGGHGRGGERNRSERKYRDQGRAESATNMR
jgi:hypothetical protein